MTARVRTGLWVVMAGWLTLAAGGCASEPTLRFESLDGQRVLTQKFQLAAATRQPDGQYDIVLVAQGLEGASRGQGTWELLTGWVPWVGGGSSTKPANGELTPSDAIPVRQVVHIRVHWRAKKGTSGDEAASANATMRWILFGNTDTAGGAGKTEMIEYGGAALARIEFGKNSYSVRLLNASLVPRVRSGDMVDALGAASVKGRLTVPQDATAVANILRELPPPLAAAVPAPLPMPVPSTRGATTRPARR